MSEATRWLAEAAQKALSMDADRARAVAECVQGLKDERDVVESLETAIGRGATARALAEQYLERRRGKERKGETGARRAKRADKKRAELTTRYSSNPYVSVYEVSRSGRGPEEGREGGESCECQARVHGFAGSCASCGRVSCEREGEGRKCGHCGGEVRRSGEVEGARDDAKLKRARGDLRRLLQYDREAAERMLVYDDQSDYFDMSSGWLTKSERRAIQESELGLGRESTRVRENIERGEEAFKAESRRFLQGSSDARHKVKLMPRPVEAEPPRIDAPWNRPIHLDCDDDDDLADLDFDQLESDAPEGPPAPLHRIGIAESECLWPSQDRRDMLRWFAGIGGNFYLHAPKDELAYCSTEAAENACVRRCAGLLTDLPAQARDIDLCIGLYVPHDFSPELVARRFSRLCGACERAALAVLLDDAEAASRTGHRWLAASQAKWIGALVEQSANREWFVRPTFWHCDFRRGTQPDVLSYLLELNRHLHPRVGILWGGPRRHASNCDLGYLKRMRSFFGQRKLFLWTSNAANDPPYQHLGLYSDGALLSSSRVRASTMVRVYVAQMLLRLSSPDNLLYQAFDSVLKLTLPSPPKSLVDSLVQLHLEKSSTHHFPTPDHEFRHFTHLKNLALSVQKLLPPSPHFQHHLDPILSLSNMNIAFFHHSLHPHHPTTSLTSSIRTATNALVPRLNPPQILSYYLQLLSLISPSTQLPLSSPPPP